MTVFRYTVLATALAAAWPTLAQQAPDAGRTLQQQQQAPQPTRDGATVNVQSPSGIPAVSGGARVRVDRISIQGNSVFAEVELVAVLGNYAGQSYDLAGLRGLADRISAHYRAKGYPFARAYVLQQTGAAGQVSLMVIEGRYGAVKATGDAPLAKLAQAFLAPLKSGSVIESAALERATLLLDDLPGMSIAPALQPGSEVGTGDLSVVVNRTPRYSGEAGFDANGNRYTGLGRAFVNLDINNPLDRGDQVSLRSQATELGMWFGSLGYSLPVGGSGLRTQISYAQTSYQLGKEFGSLGASGTATVTSLGMSYPLKRSQRANAGLSASLQYKDLNDKQTQANTNNQKYSSSLPVILNFDRRDDVLGGGVTYGTAQFTLGNLGLDGNLTATDSTTARARGEFSKVNVDVARVQALGAASSLFVRVAGQMASKNLDSSEKLSLGGSGAVRAYPVGEASGDEGWYAQVELRRTMGNYTPYVFADAGEVRTNKTPWAAGSNARALAGAGLGLRYNNGPWSADAVLAWRTDGGRPQSDTLVNEPQAWVSVSYRF